MSETENTPEVAAMAAPGQVISPGAPQAAATDNQPLSQPEQETPITPQPSVAPPDPPELPDATTVFEEGAISWTATEFVGHQKTAGWYAVLGLGAVVLAGLIYLLFRDLISTAVVIVGAVVLGFYGSRQPNQVRYQLDTHGLAIGANFHSLSEFRSFALVPEGQHNSIIFMPMRRFAPSITIYYNHQDEDAIVDILADVMPMEEHHHDAIDRIMRRIRF